MFVPFDSLPLQARVWIYQSEKKLNEVEQKQILEKAKVFVDTWQSHGNDLKGSAKIAYNHFLIISIDESFYSASGCSIDKSVHFIQELEREMGLSLMNRGKQAYLSDNGVFFFSVGEAKQLVEAGRLSVDTLVFNLNVANKAELDQNFVVKARESWLGKFLKNQQLSL